MSEKNTDTSSILLMDRDRVMRSIHRMAYQIAEENRDRSNILVLGIKERGYVVARALAKCLKPLSKKEVVVRQVHSGKDKKDNVGQGDKTFGSVILVDDVIFSGRTMFNALQNVLVKETPGMLRTAVLIDRGHRNLPVEASFAGLRLPTKLDEHVQVLTADGMVKKVVLNNSSV